MQRWRGNNIKVENFFSCSPRISLSFSRIFPLSSPLFRVAYLLTVFPGSLNPTHMYNILSEITLSQRRERRKKFSQRRGEKNKNTDIEDSIPWVLTSFIVTQSWNTSWFQHLRILPPPSHLLFVYSQCVFFFQSPLPSTNSTLILVSWKRQAVNYKTSSTL